MWRPGGPTVGGDSEPWCINHAARHCASHSQNCEQRVRIFLRLSLSGLRAGGVRRPGCDLGTGGQPQFVQDVLDVLGCRCLGEYQFLGDLPVGQATRDEPGHLLLAPGQGYGAGRPMLDKSQAEGECLVSPKCVSLRPGCRLLSDR